MKVYIISSLFSELEYTYSVVNAVCVSREKGIEVREIVENRYEKLRDIPYLSVEWREEANKMEPEERYQMLNEIREAKVWQGTSIKEREMDEITYL